MITSQHKTFGCWLFLILTSFFLVITFGAVLSHYSVIKSDYFIKLDNKSFYVMISIFGGTSFLFLFLTSAFIKRISIDELSETISFKNIITRQTQTYSFSDFDGVVDTYLTHRIAKYKTIGLVKDKIVVRYIDSFWVSNYKELRQALNIMKCFGTLDFGTWKQLKLLSRRPVFE